MASDVTVRLILEGLREFVSGTKQASTAVKDTGDTAEKAGQQGKRSWKSLIKWGAAAGVAAGAAKFMKSAVSQTTALAKSTRGLEVATGMDATTSSAWVNALKQRGIQTKQFQMGMVTMNRSVLAANAGGKKQMAMFKDLGVSQAVLKKNDPQTTLKAVADGLQRMENPAKRAVYAQALFSRAGTSLLPVLAKGSKGLDELTGAQIKAGNVLDESGVKKSLELVKQQRALSDQYDGLKTKLATALMPVLVQLANILVKIVTAMMPLLSNTKLMTGAVIAITTAFVAYKLVMIASTIATTVFNTTLASRRS